MPEVVIEGLEKIIRRDLLAHRSQLEQTKADMDAFKLARAHEIKRRKYYSGLIGGGKFDDDALRESLKGITVNIQHLSDKVKFSEEKIDHHRLIVDTLTDQLKTQEEALDVLARYRREHGTVH